MQPFMSQQQLDEMEATTVDKNKHGTVVASELQAWLEAMKQTEKSQDVKKKKKCLMKTLRPEYF